MVQGACNRRLAQVIPGTVCRLPVAPPCLSTAHQGGDPMIEELQDLSTVPPLRGVGGRDTTALKPGDWMEFSINTRRRTWTIHSTVRSH